MKVTREEEKKGGEQGARDICEEVKSEIGNRGKEELVESWKLPGKKRGRRRREIGGSEGRWNRVWRRRKKKVGKNEWRRVE